MGLDMYLSARMYIPSLEWKDIFGGTDREPVENNTYKDLVTLLEIEPFLDKDKFANSITVDITVGYWRKANAIHSWFVNNCGDKESDSGLIVTNEDLAQLLQVCNEVLENRSKALELLPPMQGFFFGNYEINEYYEADLKKTVEIITRCLAAPFHIFTYDSSW